MALYNVVWENGCVALTMDLIFGLVVMTDGGWYPVAHLNKDDRWIVHRAVDNNPGFPFKEELNKLILE
jgi:hypothetical protein